MKFWDASRDERLIQHEVRLHGPVSAVSAKLHEGVVRVFTVGEDAVNTDSPDSRLLKPRYPAIVAQAFVRGAGSQILADQEYDQSPFRFITTNGGSHIAVSSTGPGVYDASRAIQTERAVNIYLPSAADWMKRGGRTKITIIDGKVFIEDGASDLDIDITHGPVTVRRHVGNVGIRQYHEDTFVRYAMGDVLIRTNGHFKANHIDGGLDAVVGGALKPVDINYLRGWALIEVPHGEVDIERGEFIKKVSRIEAKENIKVKFSTRGLVLRASALGAQGNIVVDTRRFDLVTTNQAFGNRRTVFHAIAGKGDSANFPVLELRSDEGEIRLDRIK